MSFRKTTTQSSDKEYTILWCQSFLQAIASMAYFGSKFVQL